MIGERIQASRKAAGMTQMELAVALGIHVMTVSYYEQGTRRVPAERLAQIAQVLDDPSLLQANGRPETLRPEPKEATGES